MARPKQPKPSGPARKKPARNKAHETVDYKALAQFRHQLRIFLAFTDKNIANAGLTTQQYQALLAIKGFSGERPMFVGELAQLLLIKHHTAGGLIDRMAKFGLVRRTVDADDNRRVLVTLTNKGMLRLQKVATVNFQHLRASGFTKILKPII